MCKFKNFVKVNLPNVLAEETAKSLGDRSKYIGASDIGSCLRKAYLSKVAKVEHDIGQHIVFERGHIAEGIVEKMVKYSTFKLHKQVEVTGKANNGFPIKAHIDFVIDGSVNGQKEYVVVEAKSTSIEVDKPYDSWIYQTQLQMHLLKQKHPERVIRGYIVAIDVNTGWFDTFEVKPNQTLLNIAMDNANILAEALEKNVEPVAEVQLYCSKCPYKTNCPAITKMTNQHLPADIQYVIDRLSSLNAIDKEIKSLKKQLQGYMEATNTQIAKSGNNTVSLHHNKGRETVDVELLKAVAPDIYEKVKCDGDGYSYIKVV